MSHTDTAQLVVQLAVGLNMVLFGLHQIRKPESWNEYIPKWLGFFMPMSREHFLRLHGFGNLALGAFLMSGTAPLVAAWLALIWWVSILPFAFLVKWSIGLRDLSIIAALAALLLVLTD